MTGDWRETIGLPGGGTVVILKDGWMHLKDLRLNRRPDRDRVFLLVTILPPQLASRWLSSWLNPSTAATAIADADGVSVAGTNQALFARMTDEEGMGLQISHQQADTLTNAIAGLTRRLRGWTQAQLQEEIDRGYRTQSAPVIELDAKGRVQAGADALFNLTEERVVVVVVEVRHE
jgi:hypothetical protein